MARGANSLADIDGKGRENGAVDEGSSFPAVSAQTRRTEPVDRTGPGRSPPMATFATCAGGPASGRAQITSSQAEMVSHDPSPLFLKRTARLAEALPHPMPLLLTGRGFRQELERAGVLALYAPLEGGAETRLLRRLRAAGYRAQITSARGLGDPEAFLLQLPGVRPPHLGHQSVGRGAAVGEVQMAMPQLGHLFEGTAPVLLWLLEGQVLSRAELESLLALTRREPRLKIVVELGGARALRWTPLETVLQAAA